MVRRARSVGDEKAPDSETFRRVSRLWRNSILWKNSVLGVTRSIQYCMQFFGLFAQSEEGKFLGSKTL